MILAKSSSKFEYSLFDRHGTPIGTLKMPTGLAVPRNSPVGGAVPASLRDHVTIELNGRHYRIEHELLSDRAWHANDLRFFLMDGEQTRLSIDTDVRRGKRWTFEDGGNRYELVRTRGFFMPMLCHLHHGREIIGRIADTTGFTLWTRTFEIDLAERFDLPLQVFLFFLAVNATFR